MIGVHGTPYFVLMYPDHENHAHTCVLMIRWGLQTNRRVQVAYFGCGESPGGA
jgi:hypothetical protein